MTVLHGFLDRPPSLPALVRLQVRRPDGTGQPMTFEIDTGGEPMLLTSMDWLEVFDPTRKTSEHGHVATMADGREVDAILTYLDVEWFGVSKLAEAIVPTAPTSGFLPPDQKGSAPNGLLGRSMLRDCRLTIDYARRTVAIEPSEGVAA